MCKACQKRREGLREALSKRDALAAVAHAMKGAAELVGVKKKDKDDKSE